MGEDASNAATSEVGVSAMVLSEIFGKMSANFFDRGSSRLPGGSFGIGELPTHLGPATGSREQWRLLDGLPH